MGNAENKFERVVTRGSVRLKVTQIQRGAKKGSYRVQGPKDGKFQTLGVYTDRAKALEIAGNKATELHRSESKLDCATSEQKQMFKELMDSKVTIDDIRILIRTKGKVVDALLSDVLKDWETNHVDAGDYSIKHRRDLKLTGRMLSDFLVGNPAFFSITGHQLNKCVSSLGVGAKRRKNIRGYMSSLWNWAIGEGYCSENVATKIRKPVIKKRSKSARQILTPDEYAVLLHNVSPDFVAWLAIGGFAGLRTSEICGNEDAPEDRLDWSDFDWERDRIIVRPETSKTDDYRYVPICDALAQWLDPVRKTSGYVHETIPPYDALKRGDLSETKRLGQLIGGWRSNCLRKSRVSYRVAQTNDIKATAREDGHDGSVLRSEYLNNIPGEEGERWFSLTPTKASRMVEGKIVGIDE